MHFTGKQRDSGLDNFGTRFDSSRLGRFMSPDPLMASATVRDLSLLQIQLSKASLQEAGCFLTGIRSYVLAILRLQRWSEIAGSQPIESGEEVKDGQERRTARGAFHEGTGYKNLGCNLPITRTRRTRCDCAR
jgi:hypothetical protein